jgi:hypothetical protein
MSGSQFGFEIPADAIKLIDFSVGSSADQT